MAICCRVKRWWKDKGHGFAQHEDLKGDIFFHYDMVQNSKGYVNFSEGELIEVALDTTAERLRARKVWKLTPREQATKEIRREKEALKEVREA